ncbi:MAG: helix-turn-helix domain-containing protein [Chloroflexi bacterium]|nr:helix-turn-helix domain-containing protein [Chloroflexota bacterium]
MVYYASVGKGKQARRYQWDGRGIKALRRHMGLTQDQLAGRLGTRQQTISEWETGMYRPRGTSATLLSIVAEQAGFQYEAAPQKPGKP